MAGKPKKGGLTMAVLLGKPKMGEGPMSSPESDMEDEEGNEGEEEGEGLPLGLEEAVAEFKAATDDATAARALYDAIKLCME